MSFTYGVLRASKVLTTSYVVGASLKIDGKSYLSLFCSYTRAGAGGAVSFYPQFSHDGGTTFHRQAVTSTGSVTAGSDTTTTIQANVYSYQSTAAGAETFTIELGDRYEKDLVNATHVQIVAKETSGNNGTFSVFARYGDLP